MATAVAAEHPRRTQPWIVSPWWDLGYIVVTPLLIAPIVLIAARRWLTPEQVSLAVISFASLGHHLPGFMRAYGDRDLFRRFYLRFLLVPPMVFGIALVFSPPSIVAETFHLPWRHLHGLELVLLIWGTWHGLMQTYGFMRIYDVRQGANDRSVARLDFWLCVIVFFAGVIYSDARVFGIARGMADSGLPIPGPDLLIRLRMLTAAAGLLIGIAYLAKQIQLYRSGRPTNGIKLLLIAVTGWFFWYTGRLSVNLLIGIAMFEIYHAIQYNAIVWIYNKRLFRRAGEHFQPLGFLFRDRWTMLGLYLAAIGAYSSIRYFSLDANAYIFSGFDRDGYQWLVAVFVTSAFLHFYFDGFIWKVTERNTQANLVEQPSEDAPNSLSASAFVHAAKWALLLGIVGLLVFAEKKQLRVSSDEDFRRLALLSALTPDLPECHALLCRHALTRGDAKLALEHAQKVVQLRDRSHTAHADLGLAYLQDGQLENAREQLEQAVAIAPDQWEHHAYLGTTLDRLGNSQQAEAELLLATKLEPKAEGAWEQLAEHYLHHQQFEEAAPIVKKLQAEFPGNLVGDLGKIVLLNREGKHDDAVQLATFLSAGRPDDWRVLLSLGSSLNAAGNPQRALETLRSAARFLPQSAELSYQQGLAYFQLADYAHAVKLFDRATRLDDSHFLAHLQLANTYYLLGRTDDALQNYQRALDLDPDNSQAAANYGGLLAQLGMPEEAEKIFRAAVEQHPNDAQLTYNLAVSLWQLQKQQEALELFRRAEQLGALVSPEVKAALKAAGLD